MLNNNKPDSRMRDIELALRYFAFKYNIEQFDGDLKEFLDTTCEKLNSEWEVINEEVKVQFEELEKAIELSFELFGKYPFSRYSKAKSHNKFNRAIYELFSYYFSNPKIRKLVKEKKTEFVNKFIELNDDNEFVSAVNETTKSLTKVQLRFDKFLRLLLSISYGQSIVFDGFELQNGRIKIRAIHSQQER